MGRARLLYVGCAGWTIPRAAAAAFPAEGSHLERYAALLPAVEINSSFYRPHQEATYARWAATVPPGFRFSVKVPRQITHSRRLADPEPLAGFLATLQGLGAKLGPLLVQLPPSLKFDPAVAGGFFAALRRRFAGEVVCEPRHPTWFESGAEELLVQFHVARVAADPAVVAAAGEPGGWDGLAYFRLHGSPEMYSSSYSSSYLDRLAGELRRAARRSPAWCIFDNTAQGAAAGNALTLLKRLGRS
jgi:uncharacterized protein YecE (DUF72 family)